jgi:hypothetical protein
MAQTPSARSVLRTKLDGIGAAARRGKNESGSLQADDVTELLTMVAEGDAAIGFVQNIASNAYAVSHVKIVDDARSLAAQWSTA